jgi:hypothetical protein
MGFTSGIVATTRSAVHHEERSMPSIPQIAEAMQTLLTTTSQNAARATDFHLRQRRMSGA